MASSHSSGDISGFQQREDDGLSEQMYESQFNVFSTGSQSDDRDNFGGQALQSCDDPGAPSVVMEEPLDPESPEDDQQEVHLMDPEPKFKSKPKINFRASWESQSKSRNDDVSILDEVISQSAGSDGSWELYQSRDKKKRLEPPDPAEQEVQETAKVDKMPWEKGPLAPIFASEQPSSFLTSALAMTRIGLADALSPMASIKQDTPMPAGSTSQLARNRIASARVVVNDDELLAKCPNKIKVLQLLDLSGTEVGITLLDLAGGLDEAVDILQILKDCFDRKATTTILKRTSVFCSLADWVISEGLGSLWSLTGAQLYAYMCHFRESGAAASRERSCKPTLLTWAGMTDILKREERTLMGHHVEASTKSATTYNRDALLFVHSKLVQILNLVKSREMKPDASRAEKLRMLIGGAAQEDAESIELDDEEIDPQTFNAEALQPERPGLPQENVDEFQYVAPKLAGTIRVIQSYEYDKLACGRRLTVNMVEVDSN